MLAAAIARIMHADFIRILSANGHFNAFEPSAALGEESRSKTCCVLSLGHATSLVLIELMGFLQQGR